MERTVGREAREVQRSTVEGAIDPSSGTPAEAATAQKQLKVLQWALPALTGSLVVLTALHGEQQRPSQQLPGLLQKVTQLPAALS